MQSRWGLCRGGWFASLLMLAGPFHVLAQGPLVIDPRGPIEVNAPRGTDIDIKSRPGGLEPTTTPDELSVKREYALQVPLGEFFKLTSSSGPVVDAYVDREKIIGLLFEKTDKKRDVFVKAQALRLGDATVTLITKDKNGQDRAQQFKVRVQASVEYLERLLEVQFPSDHVKVTSGGDNILFVEGNVDSPAHVDGIILLLQNFVGPSGRIINTLRTSGPTQIQLDVVIARVERGVLRKMNFNFLYSDQNGFVGNQLGNLIGVPGINVRGGLINNGGGKVFQPSANMSSQVLTGESSAFFGLTRNQSAFYGFLDLLQQNQLAKILANPTLVTMNGRPADFLVGGEQPVPIVTSVGGISQPSVQFKTFGTRLVFVPILLGDGKIRLDVLPEVSTVNFNATVAAGGTDVPQFITQRLHTTVELEPGQTMFLGGLLQNEVVASISKFPVLGDLPVVGAAFRKVTHQSRETELIIAVTPRMMDPLRDCQKWPTLPGQETRDPTDAELYLAGRVEVPLTNKSCGTPPAPPIFGWPLGNVPLVSGGPFAVPAATVPVTATDLPTPRTGAKAP